MAYWEWNASGDPDCPHVVLCVHGLSRQGRDFDVLARALLAQAPQPLRVICPDVVGRGQSDWLTDPMGYQIPHYAADMLALLAQLQPQTLDWVGTSMGGLIGMVVAGQPGLPLSAPVRRLLLNDVGPSVQWQAIQRICQYLGNTGHFSALQEAADAMWAASTTFGPHTPAQWLALSQHMVKPVPGGFTLHYDPAIAVPVAQLTEEVAQQGDAFLWQLYEQIRADTLVTRGALSDLLSPQTALAMTQRGPRAKIVEFAGVGHAPTFVAADQVAAATAFLLA
jgi:pimeloyl-ACP methyl ester carboxylesterase